MFCQKITKVYFSTAKRYKSTVQQLVGFDKSNKMAETQSKTEIVDSIFEAPMHRLQARAMLIQQELRHMGITYYREFLRETNAKYRRPGMMNNVYAVINGRCRDEGIMQEVISDLESMIEKLKNE